MSESTRHPSEQDDNPDVGKRKARIQVIDPTGNALDEYLFIDWLKGGRCRIVGSYNITQEDRINPDDTTTTRMYVFDERALVWTPPPFYIVDGETVDLNLGSREAVEAWLQTMSFEIMGYIKQIPVSW